MLGGAKEKVPIYNTNVDWLNRPLDDIVELCKEAVRKDGFKALKLKVGKDDKDEDEERVGRVREAVGKQVNLMIDANQSWTIDEAVPRLKLLEKFDLVWIEEPLNAKARSRKGKYFIKKLCDSVTLRICVKLKIQDLHLCS